MTNLKNILVLLVALASLQLSAKNACVDMEKATSIAIEFVNKKSQPHQITHHSTSILFANETNLPNTYLVRINPQGFVIVSSTNNVFPVIAYSLENNFAEINSREGKISLDIVREIVVKEANHVVDDEGVITKATRELYGPYVGTMWGQVNCHDYTGKLINVTNIYTPNNYAPGCVAVSQISVMHHYNWPPRGFGSHTYTDNSGSSTGYYAVNYGDSQYDWEMMLDRYRSKESTLEQREAAGNLAFDVAVSIDMDFEYDGSTSNISQIPASFANYFRFTSLYRSVTASSFWSLLDSNMAYKKPAILAVSASFGGHSVVCDGLNTDDDSQYFYHLNMGWWGVSNGWYKIRGSFDAGGYTAITGAVMNIIPEPYVLTPTISSDSIVTQLKWLYPENAEAEAFEVQVSINSGDWATLSDNSTNTYFNLVPNIDKIYKYRVRAKTNGMWYLNSWSNEVLLNVQYAAITTQTEQSISVYPNPFSSELVIKLNPETGKSIIKIYTTRGRKIYEVSIPKNSNTVAIGTETWLPGIYFINLIEDDKQHMVKSVKQ